MSVEELDNLHLTGSGVRPLQFQPLFTDYVYFSRCFAIEYPLIEQKTLDNRYLYSFSHFSIQSYVNQLVSDVSTFSLFCVFESG